MSKTLVIVESPTKAKTIEKFLGANFRVTSSFGHVRDLPKSKMGIDIEGKTFAPKYVIPKDKQAKVKELKAQVKKSDEIIFATDEDREGEAISWHLAELFGIEPSEAKRIVFHEITKHAITEALAAPRSLDLKLVDAQQARRILDRLVGYELSPFLWKKIARGLSAGRVQSVAVRLIVEREREIQAFVPREYWTITGIFAEHDAAPLHITATLYSINGKKLDKFAIGTKAQADEILAALDKATYTVHSVDKKETKRTPPPPFRTSTLQQQANQKLGYSSKQTMRIAQQLYEGIKLGTEQVGLITYMRTDSINLSQKFLSESADFIRREYGENYTLEKPRVYKGKAKGAQEAHEAIRPTDPSRTPESIKQFLDPKQYKVYALIWRRAVATQMAAARLNKESVDIVAKQHLFRATGQSIIFDGWLKLYPELVREEMLPALNEQQTLVCRELKGDQHFTQPPARYSDATLVKTLEEHGIGRPSTYAPTIATIEARKYVERDENKRLKPLDVAMVVNDLLVEHFSDIVDLEFTARLEEDLDDIAEGKKEWRPVIAEFYEPFHKNLEEKTATLDREDVVQMRELGTDPDSGKPIYVRIGRYGAFVQKGSKEDEEKPTFASLQTGQSIETITLEEALKLLSLPRVVGQDEDGNDITVAIGRFGPYVKIKSKYYSLKDTDPYTLTREAALEVVRLKKEEEAKKIIHDFTEAGIQVLNGRYGPYITDGKKNAKIPKDSKPEDLTLVQCQELLAAAPAKKTRRKKSTAAKKS